MAAWGTIWLMSRVFMLAGLRISAQLGHAPWSRHPASAKDKSNRRWFAVQCQPNRERCAARHLTNQDFSVFLPLRKKLRRHARRTDSVLVPFFPGYLFVQFDPTRDRWRSVNGTLGVVRLVMQGEQPTPVPPGIVEALIDTCDDNNVLSWQANLTPGQSVRVLVGPFADLVGELEQMTDAGRLRVLLDIMGGSTPVFLPRENVAPADSCL